jgi:predicted nucleic acid-binding Zn ribbon protein
MAGLGDGPGGSVRGMPIYIYERDDGERVEIRQEFSDAPLETDPETGQRVRRIINAPRSMYRGTGYDGFAYRARPKDKKTL